MEAGEGAAVADCLPAAAAGAFLLEEENGGFGRVVAAADVFISVGLMLRRPMRRSGCCFIWVGGRVGRQGAVFVVGVVGTGKGERESPSSTFPFANGSKRQARFFFPIERVFFSPSSGACLSLSLFTLPSSENSPMTRVTTLTSRACPTVFFVCVERACTE